MPNFDGNENNLPDESKNSAPANINSNNSSSDVSLFDLAKKEDEHDIAETVSVKNNIVESKTPQPTKEPNIKEKINLDSNEVDEILPTNRDEAQQISLSPPPTVNQTTKQDNNIESQERIIDQSNQDHIKKDTKKSKLWLIVKFILYIVGSFIFVYLFLNFPALWSKLNYNLKEKTGLKPQTQTIIPSKTNEDLIFLSTVTLYENPSKDDPTKKIKRGPTKEELGLGEIVNNEIWIPKLDVKAPIIWDSPVDEATMMENLKHGIVHYKGTTKPGEKAEDGEGNIFVSGHSSYYWWDDGKYKTIFANLDQIEVGDEIGVGYEDYGYVYRVVKKIIVNPDQLDVLNQDTDKNILSVMTCYPVGTNDKRLIVKAEFIARGKDDPEIFDEDVIIKETPAPKPAPTPPSTPSPTPSPKIILPAPATDDIIDLLPWNW